MGLFSSEPPSHFPVVAGKRLDGTDVRFPDDLPADATLLIVSFQDELDPLSDQWARLGDRIAEGSDGRLAVVEVPVVNSKLKLLGGLATMGIRGQIETEEERTRTVPIYADVKSFRKALQVKTGDVYPILVARDGRIAWRGEGDIDMDEVAELEAAVAEVLRQPPPPFTDHPDIDDADLEDAEASEGVEDEAPDDVEATDEPSADEASTPLADAAGEPGGALPADEAAPLAEGSSEASAHATPDTDERRVEPPAPVDRAELTDDPPPLKPPPAQ